MMRYILVAAGLVTASIFVAGNALAAPGDISGAGQALGLSDSRDVAMGDVDRDGDLDAFAPNFIQPLKLCLIDGAGTSFDSGQELLPDCDGSVALGDLDGDGDLVVSA